MSARMANKAARSRGGEDLVGVGLYTPAEAGALIQVAPGKLARWLRGHEANGKRYDPLWRPQVDLGDEGLFLGFRDLMEARVVATFIKHGLSAQRVRRAIQLAHDLVGAEHPLSTAHFKTDGRSVFLQLATEADDEDSRLIDVFSRQYALRPILDQILKGVEFDDAGMPTRWRPLGRAGSIIVDPGRLFGRPLEEETGIPPEVLANAVGAEGSIEAAARAWSVPARAMRRAVAYVDYMRARTAA